MPGTIARNVTGPYISPAFQIPSRHSLALLLAGTTFSATLECTLDPDSTDWVQIAGPFTSQTLWNVPVGPVKFRVNLASGTLLSAQYSNSLVEQQQNNSSYGGPDYASAIGQIQSTANSAAQIAGSTQLKTVNDLKAWNRQGSGLAFADGSRWVFSSTGGADGGTVVTAQGGGYWNREIVDGVVNARWFGLKGDGTDESALLLSTFQAAIGKSWRLTFPATTSYYNVGSGVAVPSVGNNYTVDIHPSAQFKATDSNAPWIFTFTEVGANFSFSGGVYSWATLPTVRAGAAVLYVTGNTLTNISVDNMRILNSKNFGVYCRGMANGGSHTLRYSNIQASNCLGDGVHVENFDYSITIDNIQAENTGDDAVALTQFSGVEGQTGASTRSVPVVGVAISNITSINPTLAVVRLSGVSQAVVSNVNAVGGASSSDAILLQMGSGPEYAIPNSGITLSNSSGANLRAIFSTATVGTGNSHAKFSISNIIGTNISGDAFYLTGKVGAAGDMSDMWVDGVQVSGSVSGTGRPLFSSQAAGLHIRNFKAVGFSKPFQISDCFDVEVDNIEYWNPIAATAGIVLTNNNHIRYGRLIAMDTQAVKKMTTGLQIQNNTDVRGFGGCDVRGQTLQAVSGGGNTQVSGFIDQIIGSVTVGDVANGQAATVTYNRPVLNSGSVTGQITVFGNPAASWVGRNLAASQVEVVFGGSITAAQVHYNVYGLLT